MSGTTGVRLKLAGLTASMRQAANMRRAFPVEGSGKFSHRLGKVGLLCRRRTLNNVRRVVEGLEPASANNHPTEGPRRR
jgi:hypothetical protein